MRFDNRDLLTKGLIPDWLDLVFLRSVSPFIQFFAVQNVDPNVLTIAGFLLSIAGAGCIFYGSFMIAGILIAVAGTLDFIDGKVAREAHRVTKFGDVLDDVLDRYSDALLFGAVTCYAFLRSNHLFAVASILTLAGALMTSFIKAIGTNYGFRFRMGAIRRQERISLLVIGLVAAFAHPLLHQVFTRALHINPGAAVLFPLPLTLMMCILAISTNLSTVQRFFVLGKLVRQLDNSADGSKLPEGLTAGR